MQTAREGGLWADWDGRDKTRRWDCFLSIQAASAIVCLTSNGAVFGSHLSRRKWLPLIAPLRLKDEDVATARYLSLRSRPSKGREPVEVRIPIRDLAEELNEQLPLAAVYKDLPRGRKRPGWKRDFARSLEAAAVDLSGVSESQVAEAIRGFRAEKTKLPEITVGPSRKTA
jgi:hypothetical protein